MEAEKSRSRKANVISSSTSLSLRTRNADGVISSLRRSLKAKKDQYLSLLFYLGLQQIGWLSLEITLLVTTQSTSNVLLHVPKDCH